MLQNYYINPKIVQQMLRKYYDLSTVALELMIKSKKPKITEDKKHRRVALAGEKLRHFEVYLEGSDAFGQRRGIPGI